MFSLYPKERYFHAKMDHVLIMDKQYLLSTTMLVLLLSLLWNNGKGAPAIQGGQTNCLIVAATVFHSSLDIL